MSMSNSNPHTVVLGVVLSTVCYAEQMWDAEALMLLCVAPNVVEWNHARDARLALGVRIDVLKLYNHEVVDIA